MFHPNNHENIFSLPPELDPLSSEELLQVFPFVWQPSLKVNMWDAILSRSPAQSEAARQTLDDRVRLVAKYCIMPPKVSGRIDELLNWRSPELCQTLHDPAWEFPESTQELFEKQILKIPDGSELERSWIHASGITMPGRYPTANFAAAFQVTPEAFLHRLERYRRMGSVLVQTESYITQVAPEHSDSKQLTVGNTWKISAAADDLIDFTLGILETHPDYAESAYES